MLILLTINQAADLWHKGLSDAIVNSLPPFVGKHYSIVDHLLDEIVTGHLSVWVFVIENEIRGVLTTKIIYDSGTGTKNLLIYSLYGDNEGLRVSGNLVHEVDRTMNAHAQEHNCNGIIAYVSNESVLRVLERLGYSSETRLVTKRIGGA